MPKRQMKTYQTAEYNAILYIPITIFYIYIPNNLPFVPFLFPLIFMPLSTTSVVYGSVIVLEETQKNPIKPKAQLNPIKPTGAGFFKKKPGFFQPCV